MNDHVKTLGWIYILSGALSLGIALIAMVFIFGAGLLSGDAKAAMVTSTVALGVGICLAVLSLPSILTGRGLLQHRPWARVAGIVLGVLSLPGFPVGTLIGAYALWVLLNDQVAAEFRGAPAL
jgi:hypothetical protein